jgi:hypothetical protein
VAGRADRPTGSLSRRAGTRKTRAAGVRFRVRPLIGGRGGVASFSPQTASSLAAHTSGEKVAEGRMRGTDKTSRRPSPSAPLPTRSPVHIRRRLVGEGSHCTHIRHQVTDAPFGSRARIAGGPQSAPEAARRCLCAATLRLSLAAARDSWGRCRRSRSYGPRQVHGVMPSDSAGCRFQSREPWLPFRHPRCRPDDAVRTCG